MARYALFLSFGVLPRDKMIALMDGLDQLVEKEIINKEVRAGNDHLFIRQLTPAEIEQIVATDTTA